MVNAPGWLNLVTLRKVRRIFFENVRIVENFRFFAKSFYVQKVHFLPKKSYQISSKFSKQNRGKGLIIAC